MPPADQLLEEYLRVINDKDNEIHRLIKATEEHRYAHRKREDALKDKLARVTSEAAAYLQTVQELRHRVAEDDTTTNKLINANELLKKDLGEAEAQLRAAQEHCGELARTLQAEQAERGNKVEEAAQLRAAADDTTKDVACLRGEVAALQQKLEQAEAEGAASASALSALQSQHADAVPRSQYDNRIGDFTMKIELMSRDHAELAKDLQRRAETAEEAANALEQSLRKTQQKLESTAAERDLSDRNAEDAKQAHKLHRQEHEFRIEALSTEVEKWRKSAQAAADRSAELAQQVALKDEERRRSYESLQAAQLLLERQQGKIDHAEDVCRAEVRAATGHLQELQDTVVRLERQLEAKSHALEDMRVTLTSQSESSLRAASELRGQLGVATSAAAARREECDRLQYELKGAKHQLQESEMKYSAELTALRSRVEELQHHVQRAQEQLHRKEEECRRRDILQEKALQELHHEHLRAVEDLRRTKDGEIQDGVARLERLRSELCDNSSGAKGLARELQLSAELHRRLHEELALAQSAVVQRDGVIAGLKQEMIELQGKFTYHEQRIRAKDDEEEQLRRKVAAAANDIAAANSAVKRAENAAEDAMRQLQTTKEQVLRQHAAMEKQTELEQQLRQQLATLEKVGAALQHDVAAKVVAADAAQQRVTLAESQLQSAQASLAHMQQELQRSHVAREAAEAEAKKCREALDDREKEARRIAQHAADVEALAHTTAEELRTSLKQREDVIAALRVDLAGILPQLTEERGQQLVLRERIQHLQEMEAVQRSAMQGKLDAATAAVATAQEEMHAVQHDNASLTESVRHLQEKLRMEKATTQSREGQYRVQREELEAALASLERERADVRQEAERLRVDATTAADLRGRYKKERAKMDALFKQYEERAAEAVRAERSSRQQEMSLLEELQASEATLHDTQEAHQRQLAEVSARYQHRLEEEMKTCRSTHDRAVEAEKKYAELLAAAKTTETNTSTACQEAAHVRRCLQDTLEGLTAQYARDVIDMKMAQASLLLEGHHASCSSIARCMDDSCRIVVRAMQESMTGHRQVAAETARRVQDAENAHEAAMEKLVRSHDEAIEGLVAQHRTELLRARQSSQQETHQLRRDLDATARLTLEHEDSLQSLQMELAGARRDVAYHTKQTEAIREQRDTAEGRRIEAQQRAEEDYCRLRAESDALKRQYDDRVVELKHADEEVRELKAEVTALQQVLGEKDAQLKREAKGAKSIIAQRTWDSQEAMKLATAAQREAEARADARHAELATAQVECRRLQRHVEAANAKIESMTEELLQLRRQEAEVLGQMQARKAEVSALRERCANLESLKNISDASLAEVQSREHGLLEKLEEMRSAQHLMQLCFDRQQEQLDVGRRLREMKDSQANRT